MKALAVFMALILASCFSFAQQPECDYKVEIITDGQEFLKEDFKWRMMAVKIEGKPTNITGAARIESDGKLIKKYNPWNSEPISKQKTSSEYSPNLEAGPYEITAEISVGCEDTDNANNIVKKTITIKEKVEDLKENKIEEEQAIAKEAQNNTGEASDSYGKSIQNNSSAANEPAQAKTENSDNGLQLAKNDSGQETPPAALAAYQNIVVYESSSAKAKSLIMPMLLLLSILLNIVLIWKR